MSGVTDGNRVEGTVMRAAGSVVEVVNIDVVIAVIVEVLVKEIRDELLKYLLLVVVGALDL